jgi:hypothetical protein
MKEMFDKYQKILKQSFHTKHPELILLSIYISKSSTTVAQKTSALALLYLFVNLAALPRRQTKRIIFSNDRPQYTSLLPQGAYGRVAERAAATLGRL